VPLPNQAETEGKPNKPYQFLNIWVLREYLEIELKILDPVCEPNIERLIDDFIFICFLMGNDFIPHIPSLETHECAVDLLIEVYKTTFNKMGGYIVNTDKVKDKHGSYLEVSRLEIFFHELSMYEEKIFLKRYELRKDLLKKVYREMLCEASESERPELRRKLDGYLEDHPYDRVSDAYLDIYFFCSPTIVEMSLADKKTGITRMEILVPQGIFWPQNFQ